MTSRIWSAGQRVGPAVVLALALATGAALAHEGEDHDAPAASAAAGRPPATAEDGRYEVVAESNGRHLKLWLDDWASNAPVAGARVVATIAGRDLPLRALAPGDFALDLPAPFIGPTPIGLAIEGPRGPALLNVEVLPPGAEADGDAQDFDWSAALIGGGAVLAAILLAALGWRLARRRPVAAAVLLAILITPRAIAHGDEPHDEAAPIASGDAPARRGDGSVLLPKPTQHLLEIRTWPAQPGVAQAAVTLTGRVIADPAQTARVATAVGGRVLPIGGAFPRLGAEVRAGAALARIVPTLDAAQAQAAASSLAALDREIALANADYQRLSQLDGVVARAEINRARLTLEGLRRQRTAAARPVASAEVLRAPIAGRIRAIRAAVGEIAAPGAVVIEIEGSASPLVEAVNLPSETGQAVAKATLAERGAPLRLVGRSPGVAGGAETLQFALPAGSGLRTGAVVRVAVSFADGPARRGIVLPAEAIVREGGDMVWVKTSPLTYAPRPVRTVPAGDGVLIAGGLAAGERVVVRGASLIAQVR
ncbi:MAG: hypothetical protein K2X73_15245 [Sphingomonas sp.]|uniref:efflux RND transporter periplasmic adaptor subunit n=1 Tax=Sphingomonas sp. TaxID=28214 RepID=UPI0025EB5104|nr:hypothetical protein [Sphingomonas sp.]MBX9883306.1 hypothetical protein [Sphingomonas sp.]